MVRKKKQKNIKKQFFQRKRMSERSQRKQKIQGSKKGKKISGEKEKRQGEKNKRKKMDKIIELDVHITVNRRMGKGCNDIDIWPEEI